MRQFGSSQVLFQTFGNQSGSDEVVRAQLNMRRKSRPEVKYGDPYDWVRWSSPWLIVMYLVEYWGVGLSMSSLVTLVSNSNPYDQEMIMSLVPWVQYNVMAFLRSWVESAFELASLCVFCKYPNYFPSKITSGHLESLVADLSLHFISDSHSSEGLRTLLLDF